LEAVNKLGLVIEFLFFFVVKLFNK
jgi:hypothetical protein